MSWQSYIDDQLLAAGFMYAAILGHDGSTWANSKDYNVLGDEISLLKSLLTAEKPLSDIASSGFFVAGQKYAFTRGEVEDEDGGASFLQGRCKEEGKSAQGVIIMSTEKAMIVGVHDPAYSNGASFGKVNTEIGRIADYMMESGF